MAVEDQTPDRHFQFEEAEHGAAEAGLHRGRGGHGDSEVRIPSERQKSSFSSLLLNEMWHGMAPIIAAVMVLAIAAAATAAVVAVVVVTMALCRCCCLCCHY